MGFKTWKLKIKSFSISKNIQYLCLLKQKTYISNHFSPPNSKCQCFQSKSIFYSFSFNFYLSLQFVPFCFAKLNISLYSQHRTDTSPLQHCLERFPFMPYRHFYPSLHPQWRCQPPSTIFRGPDLIPAHFNNEISTSAFCKTFDTPSTLSPSWFLSLSMSAVSWPWHFLIVFNYQCFFFFIICHKRGITSSWYMKQCWGKA